MEKVISNIIGIVKMNGGDEADKRYVVPAQAYLMQSFPDSIEDLKDYFSGEELGRFALDLLDAIPGTKAQEPFKLNLTRNLLAGIIGSDAAGVLCTC